MDSSSEAPQEAPAMPREGLFAVMSARLRSSDDREHEMAINRLAISLCIFFYLAVVDLWFDSDVFASLMMTSLYAVLSALLFANIVYHPKRLFWRRIVAMCCDIGCLSYGMYVGDDTMAALYPIYIWIILGNGFRFGVPSLLIAMGISVLGFCAVLMHSPYWAVNAKLATGLLAGLIALPLYASKLIRNLSEAKKAAELANAAKSQFLAAVSHEFRTPLHGIIGMTDMLRRSPLDDEQKDMATTVRNSANSLLSLINEVLDFSRIEAGQMPSANADFDLCEVLEQVRDFVAVQAESKGLRFSLHVCAATPQRLSGDARHLADILTNLAGNGVKFTQEGSVTVAVSVANGAAETDGALRLRFEVSDTGIGIAKEACTRIFEHFSQADDTIINRFGGTGLGLAIVKKLVEMHGGTVGMESTPGEGSTFWFELPMKRAQSDALWVPQLAAGQAIVLSSDTALVATLDIHFQRFGLTPATTGKPAELVTLLRAAAERGIRRCLLFLDEHDIGEDPQALVDALIGCDPSIAPTLVLVSDKADDVPDGLRRRAFATVLPRALGPVELRRALQIAAASGVRSREADDTEPLTAARHVSVLVADDNPTNQKVLAKILERAGHDVRIAADGEQALDALSKHGFDIVLMDLNMPVMNGIEATKLYRFASLGQRSAPVVGLTADATPLARERCLEAGMVDCITKPVEPLELLRRMEEIVAGEESCEGSTAIVDGTNVASLSAHPKFRASGRAMVETTKLDDLTELGGPVFVREVVEGFMQDTERVLNVLFELCAQRDLLDFRSRAHALRSGAANVGAQGIFAICSKLETIEEEDFLRHGSDRLRELQLEVAQVRDVLTGYVADNTHSASGE